MINKTNQLTLLVSINYTNRSIEKIFSCYVPEKSFMSVECFRNLSGVFEYFVLCAD